MIANINGPEGTTFPEAKHVRGERHTIQLEKAKSINHEIGKQKSNFPYTISYWKKYVLSQKTSTKQNVFNSKQI